jgi:hypothetical protein
MCNFTEWLLQQVAASSNRVDDVAFDGNLPFRVAKARTGE